MDQAKWALPRHRELLQSKETQGMIRPRIKLHCVWSHNIALDVFLVHPLVSADSSLILECFSIVLEQISALFTSKQRPMPESCIIWVSWLLRVMLRGKVEVD